ncbi:NrfD/PsrC family molybdoenzyme membrane anchor subunit [Roseinatronobacter monicus]|uniref:Molybdopterin-containing oxidoreductase family membrane subunit n=1 Tax=Roseinatronobacter monicus TaxID=393481 RepID=A0A543K377_9RHOB|nr:NrfD/PsrC family molybdoenzyme membrane anchor subunit [Roseinatronobacter monicus]TQM89509.1 molybdopterin-containing oxidoreductase family membrane subunit [Roseinatronobacter monicus]
MNKGNILQGPMGLGLMVVSAIVALAAFGYAFMDLSSVGHRSFNTTSQIPWGQPIATYLYFALASSGLGMIAALSLVFGFKQFLPIAKRAIFLSFVILIAGMAVLAMELGYVFRMLWVIPLNMQIQSAMFWMGVFYVADLIFLLWKFQKMEGQEWDSKTSKQIGIASFLAVLLASGNLALIFGMMSMRPFWFDGLMPIYFYLTAVASGLAAVVFFTYFAYGFNRAAMPERTRAMFEGPMPKLFAAVLGGTVLFIAVRAVTGVYTNNPEISVVWREFLFASPVYQASLWLGIVAPFVIMMIAGLRSNPSMQVLVSIAVFAGLFAERYFFVVGGQVVPLFRGTWEWGLIQYTPSMTEWALTIMGSAMLFALYAAGERFLNLSDMPAEPAPEGATAAA